MCLLDRMTISMDIFKWGKKRELGSALDTRWGDPSISAPNEGSWNEMPSLRPVDTEFSANTPRKAHRLGALFRGKRSQSLDPMESDTASSGHDVYSSVPHHPLAEVRRHDGPAFTDRGREQIQKVHASSTLAGIDHQRSESLEDLPRGRTLRVSRSVSLHRPDATPAEVRRVSPASGQNVAPETKVSFAEGASKDHPQTRFPSPGLATTARMRPHSGLSTLTEKSTPSTATFSSQQNITSVTTAISVPTNPPIPRHKAIYPPSQTRLEQDALRPPNSRRNRKKARQRSGPQELVPSYDDMWG